jgi:hypothetical protein
MQRSVNTTIEEGAFPCGSLYIQQYRKRCFLCGLHISIDGQRMFSMSPLRDYVCSPVVNQKLAVEREREWSESSAVKEEGFG